MNRRAGPIGLGAVVLFAALASAQTGPTWHEVGGGPDRASVAMLGTGPLDVVVAGRFLGDDEVMSGIVGPVVGPDGMLGAAVDLAESPYMCTIFHASQPIPGPTESSPPMPCGGGGGIRVVAYVPSIDAAVLCPTGTGDMPVLVAVNVHTWETVWSVSADDAGLSQIMPPGITNHWHCSNVAVDASREEVVAPFHNLPLLVEAGTGANRIVSVDVRTGDVRWATSVPLSVFGSLATPEREGILVDATDGGFEAEMLTLSDAGVLVIGSLYGAQRAAAWLDRDGVPIGGALSTGDPRDLDAPRGTSTSTVGSDWWVASGALGAAVLGDELLVVSPTDPTPLRSVPMTAPRGPAETEVFQNGGMLPAPSWWLQTLVVPTNHAVDAISSDTLEVVWRWMGSRPSIVSDVLVVPPDDVYILAAGVGGAGPPSLARVDLTTGDVLQELALPLEPRVQTRNIEGVETERWWAGLTPLVDRGELVVWDDEGAAVLLGAADATLVPRLTLDDVYPAPGTEVELAIEPPAAGEPRSYSIAWGDGVVETLPAGASATHTYAAPGPRTVRVTAIHADGRTGTAEASVHIGGAPAPSRGPLDQALEWASLDRLLLVAALALAAVVAVSETSRFAHRRREREREGLEERQLAYRRVLAREIEHGAAPEEVAERLRPLRGVIGIADREHARLEAEARALRVAAAGGARPLVPGERFLERYEVERRLGAGGAGFTYLCRDVRLGRRVVLKVLRTAGDEATQAALREARAFAAVDHDRVVSLHDVEQLGDDVYLVLEYVDGPSLAERLADGPLGRDAMRRLAEDLLSALEAVHGAGLVHRDVKPANVLVTRDGSCKLGDFGLASAALDDATAVGFDGGAGTARYMAPEQARGEHVDARSDLYAAALTLYEAWTGTPYYAPRAKESLANVHMRAAHGRGSLEGVQAGSALRTFFTRALALDPADRFQDPAAMRAALLAALEGAEDARRKKGTRHARVGDDT